MVTPKLQKVKFTPPSQRVNATSGVKDVNFRAVGKCDQQAASDIASAASDSNPCQRLYRLKFTAWLPYNSVADPFTGARQADGSDYPINSENFVSSFSFGFLGTPAYPPCLGDQVIKNFLETRPEVLWRARFLGSAQQTVPSSGTLGTVTVPIAWNGATDKAKLFPPSTTSGTLRRQYDYRLGIATGRCRTPVSRSVTPPVSVTLLSDRKFAIDLSWPIPYQPYEDLEDIKSFSDPVVAPLAKAAQKQLEDDLNQIPGYKSVPDFAKGKIKSYAISLAERGGAKFALDAVRKLLKNTGSFFASKTPPPIKYGEKALEILRKASYGSADVRIIGTFFTKESIPPILAGRTALTIESDSDAFPSFGLSVSRPQGQVPWDSTQTVTVIKSGFAGAYGNLPYVINDAVTETGPETILQGGLGASGAILSGLDILRNVTPSLLRPFTGPALVGNPKGTHTVTFDFPGARS